MTIPKNMLFWGRHNTQHNKIQHSIQTIATLSITTISIVALKTVDRVFIETGFHRNRFSPKRVFTETGFHRNGFSPKQVFTETGFHRMHIFRPNRQMDFSSKRRVFIYRSVHRMYYNIIGDMCIR
jgi:hypothetical protein